MFRHIHLKKFISVLLVSILLIGALAILTNAIITAPNFLNIPIAESGWVDFYGSLIGGLIGAIVTIYGIKITLDNEKDKENSNRKLQVLPFLTFKIEKLDFDEYRNKKLNEKIQTYNITLHHRDYSAEDDNKHGNDFYRNCVIGQLTIKNIGLKLAIDAKISNIVCDRREINRFFTYEILEVDKEYIIYIFFVPHQINTYVNKNGEKTPDSSSVDFTIEYSNIYGDYYEQKLKLICNRTVIQTKEKEYSYNYGFQLLNISKAIENNDKHSNEHKFNTQGYEFIVTLDE